MKTSVAYIDKVFASSDSGTPDILNWMKIKATRAIGGFALVDPTITSSVQATMRRESAAFARERCLLKEKLEKAGVNALAFVPNEAWNEICRRSKLLTIEPSLNGTVRISDQIVTQARKIAALVMSVVGWAAVLLAAAFPTWASYYFFNKFPDHKWNGSDTVGFWAIVVICGVVCGLLAIAMTSPLIDNLGDSRLKDAIAARVLGWWAQSSRKVAKYLTLDDGIAVRVQLPLPPADAVEVLLKAQSFPLAVTLVPEAVKFLGVEEALLKESNRQGVIEKDVARKIRALRADPIVTTKQGGVIAVLIQFGDFPIEKEVVDLVAKTDYLH